MRVRNVTALVLLVSPNILRSGRRSTGSRKMRHRCTGLYIFWPIVAMRQPPKIFSTVVDLCIRGVSLKMVLHSAGCDVNEYVCAAPPNASGISPSHRRLSPTWACSKWPFSKRHLPPLSLVPRNSRDKALLCSQGVAAVAASRRPVVASLRRRAPGMYTLCALRSSPHRAYG